MELLERGNYLSTLSGHFDRVAHGHGHTLFLTGEAGIGKTSLLRHFVESIEGKAAIYTGACDSLFTPRPLGPLFDIADDIGKDFAELLRKEKDRSVIFAELLHKLAATDKTIVLIFEDIHWVDEATIDLIKFLARRVSKYRCLFMLTYRDDEIHSRHPLNSVFGELPRENFSKVPISRLSREAVDALAKGKGYSSGDEVYSLTGGNPFYVTEVLASDTRKIPERVKDSILTSFHAKDNETRALWEFLSVLPTSNIDAALSNYIESEFGNRIDSSIASGVIISRPGHLSFKHELFRLAIEESLLPTRRKNLHKKIVDIILQSSSDTDKLSQLVHHARYADERGLVASIAPQAAKEAATVGAHIEASKLYSLAIEYTGKNETDLVNLYELHAYECYLTNQIDAAIISQQHALEIWRERQVRLKEGDTLRFLSRLMWFSGECVKGRILALEAIEVLENGFPTRERAMAYSNFAQLNMLSDNLQEALLWGNKAIDLAVRMNDQEILCHALNNVGTVQRKFPPNEFEGDDKLNESLSIALKNGFHEHAARAYTNLSTGFVLNRNYAKAIAAFEEGLNYCEELDLNSWTYFMLSQKARLLLETGKFDEAEIIAENLHSYSNHPGIVKMGTMVTLARLAMRRGQLREAKQMLSDVRTLTMPTREAARVVPVLAAELEYSWLSGEPISVEGLRDAEESLSYEKNNSWNYGELAYWKKRCGVLTTDHQAFKLPEPFQVDVDGNWRASAALWRKIGAPYEEALALSDGDDESKKNSLRILDEIGASGTVEMLRTKLKLQGMKKIPRGARESTKSNPAQLTNRQIDVLNSLSLGLQNSEIADKLFISSKTVDHHISSILSKLGVNTRAKAVSEARRRGILK